MAKVQKYVSLGVGYASAKSYKDKEGKEFAADIKDGDIVIIKDGGTLTPDNFNPGKEKRVFKIETRNGVKGKDFNTTTMNNLIEAYGDETDNWVGKEVKLWIFRVPSTDPSKPGFKYNVYGAPKNWDMNEEGKFLSPEKASMTIGQEEPVEDGSEMNWDDLGEDKQ